MILSINQPAYLPWLGYFERIALSDVHVILDDVQFEKNSMINRNKIRTHQNSLMLTVPLLTKGRFGELPINSLAIDNTQKWAQKHWKSIQGSYAQAPFAQDHMPFFQNIFTKPWTHLSPLMRETTDYLLDSFNIKTKMLYSSDLDYDGKKSDLVLNICHQLGASTYISGPFGRDYLDLADFSAKGIEVVFHDYQHPVYKQSQGGFEPYMSALDLLLNCGPESRAIMETTQL